MHDQPPRPTRRSTRLPDYDYSQAGAYFVTVCTYERRCLFGAVVEDAVQLNVVGKALENCWLAIPEHFPHVSGDAFVVMPNHLHGVIMTGDSDGEVVGRATPGATCGAPTVDAGVNRRATVGQIVQAFKAACTKQVRALVENGDLQLWQRGYYEHVIRGEAALARICQYIADNPAKWALDHDNPANWRR